MLKFPNASESFKGLNAHIFGEGTLGQILLEPKDSEPTKQEIKSEKELQIQLVNLLRLRNIEPLWHRTDKKSSATVGWPDLTFAVTGKPILWEVKLPGRKLSEEQQKLRLRLIENGWDYYVIHSVDEGLEVFKNLCD